MMKHVTITGSTRGIGFGLADAFLATGCRVTISSRNQDRVEAACQRLSTKYETARVFGFACDVTRFEDVQALWNAAHLHFGAIDTWINNAGVAQKLQQFQKLDRGYIDTVLSTNISGLIYGTKVALAGMLEQGSGKIFSMEGFGSDGQLNDRMTLYGTSKRAVRYFTQCVVREVGGSKIIVGSLSPGMVITGLLTGAMPEDNEQFDRAKKAINILADRVETIAPFLAAKVLAARKNGVRIKWLTKHKILWRFLTAKFRKRDLFLDAPPVPVTAVDSPNTAAS